MIWDPIPILTPMFNSMLIHGFTPSMFKEGTINQILKKGKDLKCPTNYRGISTISSFGKLFKICLMNEIWLMNDIQNLMQCDFTKKVSPIFATVILSEVINEFADNKQDLTVILLDAEKVFDKVWHNGLQSMPQRPATPIANL